MKYSNGFERDFKFFMRMRRDFTFSGDYLRLKSGEVIQITHDINGADGKRAFHIYDSTGKIVPTRHPRLFYTLLKTKASTNFHIKMYAETRATGELGMIEFRGMCIKWKAPFWFRDAVEKQKVNYYKI